MFQSFSIAKSGISADLSYKSFKLLGERLGSCLGKMNIILCFDIFVNMRSCNGIEIVDYNTERLKVWNDGGVVFVYSLVRLVMKLGTDGSGRREDDLIRHREQSFCNIVSCCC